MRGRGPEGANLMFGFLSRLVVFLVVLRSAGPLEVLNVMV